MDRPRQVANVPAKPVMLYDGDCRFCTLWVRRWMQITQDAVEYVPFQDGSVADLYPELSREQLAAAVQFIDNDGSIYQGAEAVFRSLATNRSWNWMLGLYRRSSLVARTTDCAYRFVARHRTVFSWFTRALWGRHVERPEYLLVRRVFLSCLGLIYLIAFVSLWMQVLGLVGKQGILPAADFMSQVRRALDGNGTGIDRYRLLPTLCWLGASDDFLLFQCAAGAGLALMLIAQFAPQLCLVFMWVLYLSLTTIGREFLGFQWDNLLLETSLLAIFFAPAQLFPRPSRERPTSRTMLWLLRVLLFKLMFLSGVVKLTSGDAAWRNLTALTRHYETQPLPTWIGWYVHQLPLWFQKSSCVVMFVIELGVPFLIFAPRRLRMAGAAALGLLQVVILLTGNYTFFNCLTLALCLLLLDDFALIGLLPRRLAALYSPTTVRPSVCGWHMVVLTPVAIVFLSISAVQLVAPFRPLPFWTSPMVTVDRWVSPFRSVNEYGLFRVMTMERPEIIVEGSTDGSTWKEYEFRYKPGDLNRHPRFVAPHQPRLDWQMWFAALGTYRQNPWFVSFCLRLLQGSPDVLGLLKTNPFADGPPKYVRARLYDYHFTSRDERSRTGAWWKRELKGEYLPPVSLDMFRPAASPRVGDPE